MVVEEAPRVGVMAVVAAGGMEDEENSLMVAFWLEIFLWIAGQRSLECHLRGLDLFEMCIFQRTITQVSLEDLRSWSLLILMRLLKLSTI